jgi:hypothetical protein
MRGVTAILSCCLAASGVQAKEPHRSPEAIKALDQFGRCVAEQRTDAVKFMSTLPDSKEEHKQANRISTSSCLHGGVLKSRANLLRGTVAEMLLKEDRKSLHRSDVKYTFVLPLAEDSSRESDGQRTAIALVLFGQCIAHEKPEAVDALLKTPVESRAEWAAFALLKDAMTTCSTVNFKADRFQMRGYIAGGAYRNLVAPASG